MDVAFKWISFDKLFWQFHFSYSKLYYVMSCYFLLGYPLTVGILSWIEEARYIHSLGEEEEAGKRLVYIRAGCRHLNASLRETVPSFDRISYAKGSFSPQSRLEATEAHSKTRPVKGRNCSRRGSLGWGNEGTGKW